MSVQQRSYFCSNCQQRRLFTRQGMNHTPHILASVFLCGMWLPIWMLLWIFYDAGFHCSFCGYSDAPRHLANPHLRQQRQEQMTHLAQQTEKYFHLFVQWFKSLTLKWKIAIIATPIVILALLNFINTPSKKADFTSKNSNNNANLSTNPSPLASVITTNTNSTREILDFHKPEIEARINKGEQIYRKIESTYKLPIMFGWQGKDITLLIPEYSWDELTKDDQINLTYYAQNLISDIKGNPAPYVEKWSSYHKKKEQLVNSGELDGLSKSSYLLNVQKLCSSCWKIAVGRVESGGFYDDEYPVTGENVQSFRTQK